MKKVVKAIILKENKILLLKRAPLYERKKIQKELQEFKFLDKSDIWDLPGGGLDKDESEIDALKREVKEELNLDIVVLQKYTEWTFINLKGNKKYVNNYICKIINNFQKIKLSEEHKEYQWVSIDKLKNYKVKDNSFYKSIENLTKDF